MAVDEIHGLMYWSDSGEIKQATLNGSSMQVVLTGLGKLNQFVIVERV